MERGELIVVAGKIVVAEDVKPGKVKVLGQWLAERTARSATPREVRYVHEREARRWASLERDVRRLVRLIEQAERGRI